MSRSGCLPDNTGQDEPRDINLHQMESQEFFLCETILGKMNVETENYIRWRVRSFFVRQYWAR